MAFCSILFLFLLICASPSSAKLCSPGGLEIASNSPPEDVMLGLNINASLLSRNASNLTELCSAIIISKLHLTLQRHHNSLLTYQRQFPTSCAHISPSSLVLEILQRSDAEPVIVTDFGDAFSIQLVNDLMGSANGSGMVVDLNRTSDWTFVQKFVTKKRFVLIICGESCTRNFLLKAEERGLGHFLNRWLLVHPQISTSSLRNISDDIRLSMVTPQRTVFEDSAKLRTHLVGVATNFTFGHDVLSDGTEFCHFDLLNKNFMIPGFEIAATWSPGLSSDTLIFKRSPFDMQVTHFHNRSFTVVTLEYAFFVRKPTTPNGKWTGLTFQILDAIAEEMNFTYTVTRQPDEVYGVPVDSSNITGPWTGMVGAVSRKEFDFSVATFSVTSQRMVVIDFSDPIYRDWQVAVIKMPEPNNRRWIFVELNQPQVWAALIGSIVVMSTAFWLVNNVSEMYKTSEFNRDFSEGDALVMEMKRFGYALFYFAFSIVAEGGNYLPANHSSRVMVIMWWVFCVIFIAIYCGNLCAQLAVNVISLPFTTLEEMVSQTEYVWGLVNGVVLNVVLQTSENPIYKSLYERRSLPSPVNYEEGYHMLKENFVFLAELGWLRDRQSIACNVTMLQDRFFPTSYAWVFPEASPLGEVLSKRISNLMESGVIQKWTDNYVSTSHCSMSSQVKNAALTLSIDTVQGAFILLACGVAIGILFLIVEEIYVRCRRSPVRAPQQRQQRAQSTTGRGSVVSAKHAVVITSLRATRCSVEGPGPTVKVTDWGEPQTPRSRISGLLDIFRGLFRKDINHRQQQLSG